MSSTFSSADNSSVSLPDGTGGGRDTASEYVIGVNGGNPSLVGYSGSYASDEPGSFPSKAVERTCTGAEVVHAGVPEAERTTSVKESLGLSMADPLLLLTFGSLGLQPPVTGARPGGGTGWGASLGLGGDSPDFCREESVSIGMSPVTGDSVVDWSTGFPRASTVPGLGGARGFTQGVSAGKSYLCIRDAVVRRGLRDRSASIKTIS